jgi:ATP-dependent 26S proteasome regulatory subunit
VPIPSFPLPPRHLLQRGIDLKKIGEGMTGASGAELKAVCTEAGMFALRERRVHVTQVGAGRPKSRECHCAGGVL